MFVSGDQSLFRRKCKKEGGEKDKDRKNKLRMKWPAYEEVFFFFFRLGGLGAWLDLSPVSIKHPEITYLVETNCPYFTTVRHPTVGYGAEDV